LTHFIQTIASKFTLYAPSMAPNQKFARKLRWRSPFLRPSHVGRLLHELRSASRDSFAVTLATAVLALIFCTGFIDQYHDQANACPATTQSNANAVPKKLPPSSKSAPESSPTADDDADDSPVNSTGSALHTGEFPTANDDAGDNSSSDRSSVGWQYCIAPSYAEHKVYVSPPFSKNTDTQIAFRQMLVQAQHDDVQCPIGDNAVSVVIMREHAIDFNRKAGNTIVLWEPPQFGQPGDENIHTGNNGLALHDSKWQYCLATSYAGKKVYISPPFPKSASLSANEAAFTKMLSQSNIKHEPVQCPIAKDKSSISSMREHAISFNHDLGKTIVTLNWKPIKWSGGVRVQSRHMPPN
jgi:hypothetical protein